jgi:hypothetical protein
MEITGGISHPHKQQLEERFVIGPVMNNDFWDERRACLEIDRGPCRSNFLNLRCQLSEC